MRVPSFEVRNERSIRLAQCEAVPRLMVVAGPNGAGKSTLLNGIKRHAPNHPGRLLYVGPHRTFRRQQVQLRYLHGAEILMRDLLQRNDTPNYEGIKMFDGTRDPWNSDDTSNYLKHGLCQLEIDRKDAITARADRHRRLDMDEIPDPFQPLRDLASHLLPHLSFHGIDVSDRQQVKCLWAVHTADTLVDLDDLSSGEKSIIQMFYPLIEHRIKRLLKVIREQADQAENEDVCVLIDEPELHLHPNLQFKVFDYFRVLASDERTQFIIATHSPSMVEFAAFEELFLLRPVELVAAGENQLVQVATDEDRLKFLREVFGTTANVTAMQPIVIVEGTAQQGTNTVSDRKMYRALHPGFDQVTVIPGGGKAECIRLRETLGAALAVFTDRLSTVALLDRDLNDGEGAAGVHLLPVGMIENLLLDPDAIWDAIQSVVEKTGLASVDDVSASLAQILDDAEPGEVERRILSALGVELFRPHAPIDNIPQQAAECAERLVRRFSAARTEELRGDAARVVADLRANARRREFFHGKTVLDQFYSRHVHKAGLPRGVFKFETARQARRRRVVNQFFDEFFNRLRAPE